MAQQGQFWDETKSTLQTILEIVRSHYQEAKLFNEHLKNYNQQETGNNEEGNGSVPEDVCQSKEELEEINGENLRETNFGSEESIKGRQGEKISKINFKKPGRSIEDRPSA